MRNCVGYGKRQSSDFNVVSVSHLKTDIQGRINIIISLNRKKIFRGRVFWDRVLSVCALRGVQAMGMTLS